MHGMGIGGCHQRILNHGHGGEVLLCFLNDVFAELICQWFLRLKRQDTGRLNGWTLGDDYPVASFGVGRRGELLLFTDAEHGAATVQRVANAGNDAGVAADDGDAQLFTFPMGIQPGIFEYFVLGTGRQQQADSHVSGGNAQNGDIAGADVNDGPAEIWHHHRHAEGGVLGNHHDITSGQFDHSGVNAMPGANQHRGVNFAEVGENNPVKRCFVNFTYLR